MTVISLHEADHASHLRMLPTQTAQIRYACDVIGRIDVSTSEVRTWLQDHGVDVARSYASTIINVWRMGGDTPSTGEVPVATPAAMPAPSVDSRLRAVDTVTLPGVDSVTPLHTSGRWYRRGGALGLVVVAAIGACLSWSSLYEAAIRHVGQHAPIVSLAGVQVNLVGAAFPLLLDALILSASWMYVGGVKQGRPVAGWRLTSHAAIVGTIAANAAAAPNLSDMPWHVVAPAVWSVVVELVARDVLGELSEVKRDQADRIPLRLWLSAPAESVRTSWRMARTGESSAEAARIAADRCAAARDALQRALAGFRHRRTRRQITRRLWAGSIDAGDVFEAIGWTAGAQTPASDVVLRRVLCGVLRTA